MEPKLTLYNTLTRQKEPFTPLDATNIRMYVCGPTVYARPHLGNARSVVVYDVLYRLLRHIYGENHVTYVRNITDVDDKINAAAIERGISIQQLTEEVTGWFHDDMDALNCLRPTHEPRATQYIAQMIAMIERLIVNGNAYESQGHVLFSVESRVQSSESHPHTVTPAQAGVYNHGSEDMDSRLRGNDRERSAAQGPTNTWHYGMLSGRTVEEQQAGARVAVESYKKNPGDFVLWKPADAEDDASSVFDSPWGKGRPGWHIECSAMSTDVLGKDFDIHGGGADLKFPHHENEIAQSRCAHPDSVYARTWVHNGFLTVNGEKMSKSLGNFITVRDLLSPSPLPMREGVGGGGVHGEVIRLALLSTKYNEPLNWTDKLVEDAKKTLDKWYRLLTLQESVGQHPEIPASAGMTAFVEALCDDLNVPKAVSLMHNASEEELLAMGYMLGVLQEKPNGWFKGGSIAIEIREIENLEQKELESLGLSNPTDEEVQSIIKEIRDDPNNTGDMIIEQLIKLRLEAKSAKLWKSADRIRDELRAQGIILEDRPDGTTDWRRA